MLPLGKFLYIDDIVTSQDDRSKGYGSQLFDWLVNFARVQGCADLHLDSRLEREDAHRFYSGKGMNVNGYHFALEL
jgi:GNAT superfamily N-acetyltransferase